MCDKFGLMELVALLWLGNFSNEGIALLEMEYDSNVWKTINVENKGIWHEIAGNGFGINSREQEYLKVKNRYLIISISSCLICTGFSSS